MLKADIKEPTVFKHDGKFKIIGKPLIDGGDTLRLVVSQESDRTYDQIVLDWVDAGEARALSRFFRDMADTLEGKGSKVPRSVVYETIDGERDYQDRLKKGPGGRTDGQTKQVGSFLALLQHALNEAVKAYYENQGDEAALHMLRKILGMGVQCGEIHGLPKREA